MTAYAIQVCKCRQLATSSSVLYAAGSYRRLHSEPSPVSTEYDTVHQSLLAKRKQEKAVVGAIHAV